MKKILLGLFLAFGLFSYCIQTEAQMEYSSGPFVPPGDQLPDSDSTEDSTATDTTATVTACSTSGGTCVGENNHSILQGYCEGDQNLGCPESTPLCCITEVSEDLPDGPGVGDIIDTVGEGWDELMNGESTPGSGCTYMFEGELKTGTCASSKCVSSKATSIKEDCTDPNFPICCAGGAYRPPPGESQSNPIFSPTCEGPLLAPLDDGICIKESDACSGISRFDIDCAGDQRNNPDAATHCCYPTKEQVEEYKAAQDVLKDLDATSEEKAAAQGLIDAHDGVYKPSSGPGGGTIDLGSLSTLGLPNPSGDHGPVVAVLTFFLSWILNVFMLLAIIAFVITGVQYTLAFSDPQQAVSAKQNFMYSTIAIGVVGGALIIIKTIDSLLRAT